MVELLLVIITALLALIAGSTGFISVQLWQQRKDLTAVQTEQRLCPHHFKPGFTD